MIGETFGNYKVIAQLGEGGMGLVYLAEHPLIGSKVAIKVLHSELSNNAEVVSRFFTEARSVNDIRHPNIVEIADFGEKDGRCYIIMEFLEGESLAQRLRKVGSMDDASAARICMQVASALGAAHDHGIVHRDLKPDNVFLTLTPGAPEGVRVLDFGIAKLIREPFEASHKTRTGAVIGTPFYMSPEQCLARKDLDGRSDIYALGTVLYELVTGTAPFPYESFGELIVAHTSQAPMPPEQRNPRVSAEMSRVILRALEKDPANRFATMGEMMEALVPIAGVPITGQYMPPMVQTRPPTAPAQSTSVAPTTLSSAASSMDSGSMDTVPARNRMPLVIGGVMVIAAAAVVVVVMAGGGSGGSESRGAASAADIPAGAAMADGGVKAVAAAGDAGQPATKAAIAVNVVASPVAELFIDDESKGTTPVTVELPSDGTPVQIELRVDGYQSARATLDATSGPEYSVELRKLARNKHSRRKSGSHSKPREKKKPSFTVKPIE